MIEFDEIFEIPPDLLEIKSARDIKNIFTRPTLLHIDGKRQDPLFVSVLLHGNEDVGLFAIQKILQKYQGQKLPRKMIVFFGNVDAASMGLRRLDNQHDYNRIWPTSDDTTSDEAKMMATITAKMRAFSPFASIDIHNNTGKNPHYGCVNVLDNKSLQLARLFSNIIVYFQNPRGVQSMAFAQFCPSFAIECGKPQSELGYQHAFETIDALLHLSRIPDHPLKPHEASVFHTIARVTMPQYATFGFDEDFDISLLAEIEKYNFSPMDKGTIFANAKNGFNFECCDDKNNDTSAQFFKNNNGDIELLKPMMPAMLTLDTRVISQDCLCYLMERII